MNTQQAKERLDYLASKCGLTAEQKQKLYDRFFKYADNKVIAKAVDIIEANKPSFKLLDEILQNVLPGDMYDFWNSQTKPLIVINTKSPVELLVFPNILIEAKTNIDGINIIDATASLKTFIKDYEKDMVSSASAQKWEGDDRVEKRLSSSLSLGVAAILTRYVSFQQKYKDSQIRDAANKVDDARKPLELLFAVTPEELADMYLTGPSSCMAGERDSWEVLTKVGLGPSSFYSYFPFTKGAYIKKNGKIVARSILYQDLKNPAVWTYGRVYANTPEYSNKFVEALRSHNITKLETKFSPPKNSTFTMPGTKGADGSYYAPMPYLDDINYYGKGFYAEWDHETLTFNMSFEPTNSFSSVGIQMREGVIRSDDYKKDMKVKCFYCQKSVGSKTALAAHGGEVFFCSTSHMIAAGYIIAMTADGNANIVKDDTLLIKTTDGLSRFTTPAAAQRLGYYMYAEEAGTTAEEHEDVVIPDGNLNYAGSDGEGRHIAWPIDKGRDAYQIACIPLGSITNRRSVTFDY